jgi:DNA-directed RNA polymerase subunit N (RpoN/RPB10)
MYMKIKANRIRCLKCKEIIESKYRHDFRRCSCGAVAVDGGHDYLKRVGDCYEELSEVDNE